MARADSKEKGVVKEETPSTVLDLPGAPSEPVWHELAEIYLGFYRRLANTPPDPPEREALEDELILSLAHLATHSQVLYAAVDTAVEATVSD